MRRTIPVAFIAYLQSAFADIVTIAHGTIVCKPGGHYSPTFTNEEKILMEDLLPEEEGNF
jgi:hypothetical protein